MENGLIGMRMDRSGKKYITRMGKGFSKEWDRDGNECECSENWWKGCKYPPN